MKLGFCNYHTHTFYCDGRNSPRDFIEKALTNKMYALGFSAHSPVNQKTEWNMDIEKLPAYLTEINQLKEEFANKLQLFCGMEVDYLHGFGGTSRFKDIQLDYTIGAVHYMDNLPNGETWIIDHTPEIFENGMKLVFENDIKKLVARYYFLLIEMIKTEKFDMLAHFDLVKKFNRGNRFFDENASWYKELCMNVLYELKNTNIILELNTAARYRNLTNEYYPANWIVKEALNLKIPMTINADAHQAQFLCGQFPEAALLLKNIGYKEIWILDHTGWNPRKFDEYGIE